MIGNSAAEGKWPMRAGLIFAAVICLLLTPVFFVTGTSLFTYPTNDPPLWLNIVGGIGFWFWWTMPIFAIAFFVAAVRYKDHPPDVKQQ
jgi:polyferredoxin